MKWIFLMLIVAGGLFLLPVFLKNNKTNQPQKLLNSPTPQVAVAESSALFIPYWSIPDNPGEVLKYDVLYYFGITGTSTGINTFDQGYRGLTSFIEASEGHKTYLTLRLLDTDENLKLLKNNTAQNALIDATIKLAKDHGFSGILMDLELSALPFDNVTTQVSTFEMNFYNKVKEVGLKFSVAAYGDTFYRKRPFDMSIIGQNADEVLVMAYDFHKANGEPGPNFPLDGATKYGYDFKHMVDDFRKFVPPEKMRVAFGMYGYDWTVDDKKRPIKQAKALPYKDIKEHFLGTCEWKNCLVLRNAESGETEIDYVDSTSSEYAINHIIWFEDQRSISLKTVFLKKNGIGATAIWVYGYF